jgi:hypothetical protein
MDEVPRRAAREAVAVFGDVEGFQAAIDALQGGGFARADIETVARRRTVERLRGRFYDDVAEIEGDPSVPRASFVSRTSLGDAEGVAIGVPAYGLAVAVASVLAAAGAETEAIAAAVAAAGSAGGAIGLLGARLIERSWRRWTSDQIERGGLVLWVALRGPAEEALAARIIAGSGARRFRIRDAGAP